MQRVRSFYSLLVSALAWHTLNCSSLLMEAPGEPLMSIDQRHSVRHILQCRTCFAGVLMEFTRSAQADNKASASLAYAHRKVKL